VTERELARGAARRLAIIRRVHDANFHGPVLVDQRNGYGRPPAPIRGQLVTIGQSDAVAPTTLGNMTRHLEHSFGRQKTLRRARRQTQRRPNAGTRACPEVPARTTARIRVPLRCR